MLIPELNFLMYVLASVGALVIGFMLSFSIYFLFSWLKEIYIKKKMPRDLNDRAYLNPGKPIKRTEKEVEDDERHNSTTFREYEKLRRLGEKYKDFGRTESRSGGINQRFIDQRSELFKQHTDNEIRTNDQGSAKSNQSSGRYKPQFR